MRDTPDAPGEALLGVIEPASADACRALLERLDELSDVRELADALHDAAPA